MSLLKENLTTAFVHAMCTKTKQTVTDDETALTAYDTFIRYKHDLLHYCVCEMLDVHIEEEKPLREYYPKIDHPDMMRTPDIVYDDGKTVLIVDVTVTTRYYDALKSKQQKYDLLGKFIEQHLNRPVKCLYFIYDQVTPDINKMLYLFRDFIRKDFPVTLFETGMEIISNSIDLVCTQVSKEVFENYKKQKYSLGLEIGEKLYSTDFDLNEEEMENIIKEKYDFDPEYRDEFIDELPDILKEILEDPDNEINQKYTDVKNQSKIFDRITSDLHIKNKKYHNKPKPTHHVIYPFYEQIVNLPKCSQKGSEQEMVNNFLEKILLNKNAVEDQYIAFIKEIAIAYNIIWTDHSNKKCLIEGVFVDNQEELKLKYKESNSTKNKNKNKKTKFTKTQSFYDYLIENKYIILNQENKETLNKIYTKKRKIVHIPNSYFGSLAQQGLFKSGVSYWKNVSEESLNKIKVKTTTSFYESKTIDNMINLLQKPSNGSFYSDQIKKLLDFTKEVDKYKDEEFIVNMKKQMVSEYSEYTDLLINTECFNYLWFNHLFYSQLMHFMSMSLVPNNYYLFNCGIPNFLCICIGGFRDLDTESGKAFMSMVLTNYPEKYDNIFFGSINKIKVGSQWLVYTKWRRLPMSKITHMKDACYSVLASTVCYRSNMRNTNYDRANEKAVQMLSVKTIISLCTTQQVAEFLMDNRYATMSAFSSYTNISKLITEKFSPPYTNCLSAWIVNRILNRLPLITKSVVEGEAIYFKVPEFERGKRILNSTGGTFRIPSLWLNEDIIIKDPQELLEEIFIYVHTMKEPSNQYHEYIKALKTIIEFQDKFDNTKPEFKYGRINNKENLEDYLLNHKGIGFSGTIVKNSVAETIAKTKPHFKKYIDHVLNENISEIITTKAVIHSLDRKIIEQEKVKLKDKKIKKKYNMLLERYGEKEANDFKEYIEKHNKKLVLTSDSHFYNTKIRQKVWETAIEYLEEKQDDSLVIDIVKNHIRTTNFHVEADICIKAQFGAKREFYVINFGAKAGARVVEKFFQKISEDTPNEAISIPGDKKVYEMQNMLDSATSLAKEKNMKIRYVNGDCTKWSAAETMGSFISMTDGLNTGNKKFELLLKTIFSSWAKKDINIPVKVLDKVQPIINQTKFLKNTINQDGKFKSTHNFLQGMFNYASSYKAVCCSNYTISMWERIYGPDKLYAYHMEHSDDYVMIILYYDEKDFTKFRILHKIMMRLHGFADSDRKTSCQQLFLEFVSLMSFNGVTLYPHIKKSKEVNTSLPCTGYKTDMQAALSRVGECLRVGCNLPFSYFFQKLHVYCIAEAYSLLPGMKNDFEDDMYNKPIELYGLPDQFPLFSLLCTGDINNYRIYNYSESGCKMIKGLYNLSKKQLETDFEETFLLSEKEQAYSLFHPKYLYDYDNKSIKKIREVLNIQIEDVKEFWEIHPSYRFLKPNNTDNLRKWLKCMLYNRSFLEAYSLTSRTKMTMRISRYVNTPTLLMNITHEDLNKKLGEENALKTIRNCYEEMMKDIQSENNIEPEDLNILKKLLVKCDANVTAIYSMLATSNMRVYSKNKSNQIATFTPKKITWLYIQNDPSIILQKILNEEDFINDKRKPISLYSLHKDVENTLKFYNINEKTKKNVMYIQNMYNDMQMSKYKPVVMMGYTRQKLSLVDTVISILENAFSTYHQYKISTRGITQVINPHDGHLLYLKETKTTRDSFQQALNSATWLYALLWKYEWKVHEIKNLFSKIKLKFDDNYNLNDLLEIMNPGYCDSVNMNLDDQKCAAYLRALLLNKYDLVNSIANNIYSYSYNYIQRGQYINGQYKGITRCSFMYLNNHFEFVQKENEKPIMYTNTKNSGLNKISYVIALKLSNNLPEYEFELKMQEMNIEEYKCNEITSNEPIYKNCNQFAKTTEGKFLYKYLNSKSTIQFESFYPIIFTTTRITQESKSQHLNKNLFTEIEEKTMSVKMGKYRLFRLPFWKIRSYDDLYHVDDIYFDDIKLNCILENKLIQEFFYNSNDSFRFIVNDDFEKNFRYNLEKYKKNITTKYEFLNNNLFSSFIKDVYCQGLKPGKPINKTPFDKNIEDEEDLFQKIMNDIDVSDFKGLITNPDHDDEIEEVLDEIFLLEPEEIGDKSKGLIKVGFDINIGINKPKSTRERIIQKKDYKKYAGYLLELLKNKKSLYYYFINSYFIINQSTHEIPTEQFYMLLKTLDYKYECVYQVNNEKLQLFILSQIEFLLNRCYAKNESNYYEMSIYFEDNNFVFYKKKIHLKRNLTPNLLNKRRFFEDSDSIMFALKGSEEDWKKYLEHNYSRYAVLMTPLRRRVKYQCEKEYQIVESEYLSWGGDFDDEDEYV